MDYPLGPIVSARRWLRPLPPRMPALSLTFLMLLCTLLVVGCIDIEAELRLRRNETASLKLDYSFVSELLSIGVFDSDGELLPIPVARSDFERSADEIEGISVRTYRRWSNGDRIQVRVRLDFDNLTALSRFWEPLGNFDGSSGSTAATIAAPLELTSDTDGSRLRLLLANPHGTIFGERAGSLSRSFLRGHSYRLMIRLPGAVRSLSQGSARGRRATIELELPELLEARQPLWWEVSW